jgi:hypothetical protein
MVPTILFEHERSDNLRDIMDRFFSINNALKSNKRFSNENLIFIIVVENEEKKEKFWNQLENHNEWEKFIKDETFEILLLSDLENRTDDFLSVLANTIHNE